MTMTENKDKAEQKISKDELTDKQLDKAAGGSITFTFGKTKTDYGQQDGSGTTTSTTTTK
jgi:hypothetical protein